MNAGYFTLSGAFQDGKPLRLVVGACLSFTTVLLFREPADDANKRCLAAFCRRALGAAGVESNLQQRFTRRHTLHVAHAPYAAEVNAAATPPPARERTERKQRRRLRFHAGGLAAPNIYRVCVAGLSLRPQIKKRKRTQGE